MKRRECCRYYTCAKCPRGITVTGAPSTHQSSLNRVDWSLMGGVALCRVHSGLVKP